MIIKKLFSGFMLLVQIYPWGYQKKKTNKAKQKPGIVPKKYTSASR